VEVSASNCDCQYEVDAVQYADRIEIILTNFQGGYIPDPRTFTITLRTPWTNVSIDTLDPDDFTGTSTATGPVVTLTASNLALNSARWVLSSASATYNATPSASIVAPAKSATVAVGNVTINANAFDDGTISSVQYRIDPINNGAFTNMTLVSGSLYTATANLTPGTHSIQVKVTDSTGKSSTTANVVTVQ
jgi:Bacterial Ig domain